MEGSKAAMTNSYICGTHRIQIQIRFNYSKTLKEDVFL